MALTPMQTRTIRAIVNLFETSHVLGDYGQVTVLAGDTGHLTFGRSQTTLGSGNLHKMRDVHCAQAGARFASRIRPWLPRLAARDVSLDNDRALHNVLRASADDPVMRAAQDTFFDATCFEPAMRIADRLASPSRSAPRWCTTAWCTDRGTSSAGASPERLRRAASARGLRTTQRAPHLARHTQPSRSAKNGVPHGRVRLA